jgi:hypothetical protein
MIDAGFILTIQLCFLIVCGGAWMRDLHTTGKFLLQLDHIWPSIRAGDKKKIQFIGIL